MALEKKWFYYVRYLKAGKWIKTNYQMEAEVAKERFGHTEYELLESRKVERIVGHDILDPEVMTGAFLNAPKKPKD